MTVTTCGISACHHHHEDNNGCGNNDSTNNNIKAAEIFYGIFHFCIRRLGLMSFNVGVLTVCLQLL
jgi:hypothetical protein